MTDTATSSWRLRLPLGPLWFRLPVRDNAGIPEPEVQVDTRIAWEPRLAQRRQDLLDMVGHFTWDARQRGAAQAALLWSLDDMDGVLVATLYVAMHERSTGDQIDRYLDALQERLAARHRNDRIEAQFEKLDIPAGQVLRLRASSDAEPRPDDAREGVTLLETLQYWLPLPDRPVTLLFTFATPNLVAAETLSEHFDTIMERMRILR